jgi:hypothetical protein
MADRVQFILDRMTPFFHDLENLGIFNKVSIHQLMTKMSLIE